MKKLHLLTTFFLATILLNSQETKTIDSQKQKRGIYKSVAEFIANEPSIDSFYVDSVERIDFVWRGTYSLIPRYFETNKKVKEIWGFCDGTNTYIFHQFDFFLLENKGEEYSFVGFELVENKGEFGAVLIGQVMAGLGGAILNYWAFSHEMKLEARKKKMRYTLKKSGQIIHPNTYIPFIRFQEGYKINIYRKSFNELDSVLVISVDENQYNSFIPNSYQSFYFDSTKTTVKLCFGENLEECITVKLKKDESNYVQCSLKVKNDPPKVFEVYLEKGEYDSFKPEKAQKKRDLKAFVATPILESDIQKKVEIIFYRGSKKEINEPLEVLLNDSLNFSFIPNSYKSVYVNTYKNTVSICCGSNLEDCETIDIKDGDRFYVACSQQDESDYPIAKKVETEKAKYDSFKPEKAQRKRDKRQTKNSL